MTWIKPTEAVSIRAGTHFFSVLTNLTFNYDEIKGEKHKHARETRKCYQFKLENTLYSPCPQCIFIIFTSRGEQEMSLVGNFFFWKVFVAFK